MPTSFFSPPVPVGYKYINSAGRSFCSCTIRRHENQPTQAQNHSSYSTFLMWLLSPMHANCPQSHHLYPPALPQAAPPPPPPPVQPPPPAQPESSSSSSSNTSQSFTQWRFPLSNSPISHHSYSQPKAEAASEPDPKLEAVPPLLTNASLEELFHVAELQFSSGSDAGRLGAVHLLERSLVPNPRSAVDGCQCPAAVVVGVVACLREGVARKPASKVLLALCLVEGNRRVAVEAGAVTAVVEALTDAESAVAERLLAALELLCTTAEGAAEVRAHALAVPMMVQVMGRMEGGGKSTR
ncbi:UNVERIFIED_CONTAM: hypothetical protein Scaly_0895000 [Sesamum calycinum]|uniref:U-box domain-containing protein n=1 Tax=Sesamum calycinum TaxID=2727403 RepID=A0AAW2QWN7_9LAMI